MTPTPYIWKNGELVSWEKATTHVLSHALHYGTGVFEGIRAYKTEKGPAVFRLKEHVKRLFDSAKILMMKIPFQPEEIENSILNLVKSNQISQSYNLQIA